MTSFMKTSFSQFSPGPWSLLSQAPRPMGVIQAPPASLRAGGTGQVAGFAPWGTVIWCQRESQPPPLHLPPQQMGSSECAGSPTGTDRLPRARNVRTGALGRNLSLQTQVHMRFNFVFHESSTLLNWGELNSSSSWR